MEHCVKCLEPSGLGIITCSDNYLPFLSPHLPRSFETLEIIVLGV